ncbi:class I SAM-dependent methyltransferase [Neptuniibacter sp. 1_MG-2023]|uniref:class I SAM-dependent methyltransferase n=1 Tax=Neptuniibacter sp. 1_MG-2023 TaxID=3062662 RepID=UPI0026E32974|nr:class I SAM-dependent methyltransferase [Neptuniibacter sp. 1_MG-2023]MDO6594611.1 class I SAM-dependent methyltransferase [Neptuniibacter sp. 1_MG-2023]
MSDKQLVTTHYTHGDLLTSIENALVNSGKSLHDLNIEDLANVDEFHIGGRQATDNILGCLGLSEQDHLLDIGCGLGGACRYVSNRYNNPVTGIDLTEEYVESGNVLCSWVKLDQRIKLYTGSALDMPFASGSFNGAYMLHVGMNIEDKAKLCAEVYRVLKPGAYFTIYDVMREKTGVISYPVPWADRESMNFLASSEHYADALTRAGFEITLVKNHSQFALDFFKKEREKNQVKSARSPLGLHTLMNENSGIKVKNMLQALREGYIAPVEIKAKKLR